MKNLLNEVLKKNEKVNNSKTIIKLFLENNKTINSFRCYLIHMLFLSIFLCETFLMAKSQILILELHSACELQFIEFFPVFVFSCQSNILLQFLANLKKIL